MSEPLTLPVHRQRETEGEKTLLSMLVLVTIIFPGPVSVIAAAYVAQWTRARRTWREYGVLALLTLLGGVVFLLCASNVYEAAGGFFQAIIAKELPGSMRALITLWGLGMPLAPLGGVLMSIWREVWQELYGRLRNLDAYVKRNVEEQERAQSAESRRAIKRSEHEPESRPGELLLGARVGSSKRLDSELGIVQ